MRILLDCDGVIADLVGAVCTSLGTVGSKRTPDDFLTYQLSASLTREETAHVESLARTQGFCSSIPWYPSGRTFIETLKSVGDVFAVTAPWNSATWDAERRAWLGPYLPRTRVLSVPSEAKRLVRGDVLIEDHPVTVADWLAEHPSGRAVLIDRPWNRVRLPERAYRARTYAEAVAAVQVVKVSRYGESS